MADSRPLDARLLNVFDELQWMIFRLHGVHSQLFAPWLDGRGNQWMFHRPWFCFFIHDSTSKQPRNLPLCQLASICENARKELFAGPKAVNSGKCGSGLKLMSIKISVKNDISLSILLGPYATALNNRPWFNNFVKSNHIQEKERFDWAYQRLPVLNVVLEHRLQASVTTMFKSALDRYYPVIRGAKWESVLGDEVESVYPPLRTGDDLGTVIYGLFVELITGPVLSNAPDDRVGFHQLYFVRKGEGTAFSNKAEYSLVAGQATICKSGSVFRIDQLSDEILQIIAISFSGQTPLIKDLFGRPFMLNNHQQSLLREICSLCPPGHDRGHRSTQAKTLLLLMLLSIGNTAAVHPNKTSEIVLPSFESNRKRHLVQQACEFIRLNIEGPLPVKTIAGRFGISVATLYRYFSEEIGTSPANYCIRQRIFKAISLFRETDLNVSEMANRLKFSSSFHFSRVFKRISGMAPSKFSNEIKFGKDPVIKDERNIPRNNIA